MEYMNSHDLFVISTLQEALGKEIVLKLYSRNPEQKVKGITEVMEAYQAFDLNKLAKQQRQELYLAFFTIINKFCGEFDDNVNLEAIRFLRMISKDHNNHFLISDEASQIEFAVHEYQIIDSLLKRLSSSNPEVKESAKSALFKISHLSMMDKIVQMDRIIIDDKNRI